MFASLAKVFRFYLISDKSFLYVRRVNSLSIATHLLAIQLDSFGAILVKFF